MNSSIQSIANPVATLPNLREMCIQSFIFDSAQRQFILTCSYPKKVWGGNPIFFHGRFQDVRGFQRLEGDMQRLREYQISYQAGRGGGPIVLQSIRQDSPQEVEFWFGPNFGGVEFAFGSLECWTRETKAEQLGKDFLYQDCVSGAEIDYFHPFADLPRFRIGDT